MALGPTDRKLFLGARMKRMRRDLGLTQTRMADDLGIARHEVSEVADSAPAVSEAIVRLYRAYLDQRRLGDVGRPEDGSQPPLVTPSDWVRDFIQAQKNHFAELEEAADALSGDLK